MSATSWQVLSAANPTPMCRGPCPPTLTAAHGHSPHVQLRQGVQPGRGGPWGREDRARQGNQRDLVCRVHPAAERGRGGGVRHRRASSPPGRTGESDPGGGPSISSPPRVLTEGPGSPGKPLSPLCPGRPTTPRWPAIPWGPGVPGAPCGDKQQLRWWQGRGPPSRGRARPRDAGLGASIPGSVEGVQWGVTYDGAVSAGRALLARGSGGASGAGLARAASGAGFTAGSFAAFLPAGAGGAGEANVPLGGGQAMPSGGSPGPPQLPAEGRPGVSQCQLGQGGPAQPPGRAPGTSHPASPQHPPPPAPISRPAGAGGTHRGAGGTNSSSSTRETSSTLEERKAGVGGGRIQAPPAPAVERVQGTVPWLGATAGSPGAGGQEESVRPGGSWG